MILQTSFEYAADAQETFLYNPYINFPDILVTTCPMSNITPKAKSIQGALLQGTVPSSADIHQE